MAVRCEKNWFGFRYRFPRAEDGSLDWSMRPRHKRWSLSKLGKFATLELIETIIPVKSRCFYIRSDLGEECGSHLTLKEALKAVFANRDSVHHWIVHPENLWILEFSGARLVIEQFPRCRS